MIKIMFDVPMFHYPVNDFYQKKKALLQLKHEVVVACNYYGSNKSDFYTKKTSLAENSLLEHILYQEISAFSNEIRHPNFFINNFWFEESVGHQQHFPHTHGSYGYSAIMYLDYIPGLHSPTCFMFGYKHFLNDGDVVFITDFVKEGDIVFFPSSVIHYTLPNSTDIPRQVLSFNLSIPEKINV